MGVDVGFREASSIDIEVDATAGRGAALTPLASMGQPSAEEDTAPRARRRVTNFGPAKCCRLKGHACLVSAALPCLHASFRALFLKVLLLSYS